MAEKAIFHGEAYLRAKEEGDAKAAERHKQKAIILLNKLGDISRMEPNVLARIRRVKDPLGIP